MADLILLFFVRSGSGLRDNYSFVLGSDLRSGFVFVNQSLFFIFSKIFQKLDH